MLDLAFNPLGTENIRETQVINNVAADALAACVARSSAAMILTVSDKQILIFHELWIHSAHEIDGLVQVRRNSIANALELRLSCTNPLK